MSRLLGIVAQLMVAVFVVGGLSAVFFTTFSGLTTGWDLVWKNREAMWIGWISTVAISLVALVFSIAFALVLLLGRKSPFIALRWVSIAYVEIIRSSPLLVQLMVGVFLFLPAIGIDSAWWAGVLVLSSFSAAYLSEIFRGGIESIGKSQREAARAVGFDRFQAYRFVIIPQAIRRVIPATVGQFINLIKDSSLLKVVGVTEFMRQGDVVAADHMADYSVFLPVAIGYILLTLPLSLVVGSLERRFSYET